MKEWVKGHLYCLSLLYFIFYLTAFFLLEHYVTPKFTVHCFIDDWIPFCEYFIIPYFMWFILLGGSLGYFMLKDKASFQDLCFLMFTGMTICIVIYTFLPNGLNLRGDIPKDNFCSKLVKLLYQMDTPTNVCPSIHVSSTIAIYEVVKRAQGWRHARATKVSMGILAVLICLATMFLKQHSVIDVILGYLLTKVLCKVTYEVNWRGWMASTHLRILL